MGSWNHMPYFPESCFWTYLTQSHLGSPSGWRGKLAWAIPLFSGCFHIFKSISLWEWAEKLPSPCRNPNRKKGYHASAGLRPAQQDLHSRLAPFPRQHEEASPSQTSTWTLTWSLLAEVAGAIGEWRTSTSHQPGIPVEKILKIN